MFRPEDPLAPREAVFEEPWQAQALALADSLVRAGAISPTAWAEALGAALRSAEDRGDTDDNATYYVAVVEALEKLTEHHSVGISGEERANRRAAWGEAYRRTPHGQPVKLTD